LELRFPRLLVDFLFLAAKVPADYAELRSQKQDRTARRKFQISSYNIQRNFKVQFKRAIQPLDFED
jgi:hypothetical protein